jgi:hypothetical protein
MSGVYFPANKISLRVKLATRSRLMLTFSLHKVLLLKFTASLHFVLPGYRKTESHHCCTKLHKLRKVPAEEEHEVSRRQWAPYCRPSPEVLSPSAET